MPFGPTASDRRRPSCEGHRAISLARPRCASQTSSFPPACYDAQHASRMHKDFDRWNKTKKKLNAEVEPLYFREGEIWWVHLGVNIGYEIDGKRENFARPVIVLRKYNKYSF